MIMGFPQYGGEGKANYKGNKTDAKLPQHGGEGGGLPKKDSSVGYTPGQKPGNDYTGPGRNLKSESY